MAVDAWYWAYATIQSLKFFATITAATFYLVWWFELRHNPPRLRVLLLLIAGVDIGLSIDAAKWIVTRALDPGFSVSMIQTVAESRGYIEYAAVSGFLVALVCAQLWPIWRVRRQSGAGLAAIFAALVVLSSSATGFHKVQIDDYCRGPPVCRIE